MNDFEQGKLLVGVRECAKAVRAKQAKCVYIAEDALASVVAPIADECRIRKIEIVYVPEKAELGKMAGIERAASVVCALKDVEEI